MAKKVQQQKAARTHDGEARAGVDIVPFDRAYRDDFRRLNVEWLEKYFEVEGVDERILTNPEAHIIDNGGFILFARAGSETIGTVALIKAGDDRFELSKMAVTEAYQGRGIGRKLAEAAIGQFIHAGARELYLESNSRLTPALTLYESLGFVHEELPVETYYERADVYMVYRPDGR